MKKIINQIVLSSRLAPLLSGLLIAVAFPPFPTGFLAWIALLPLLASFIHDDFHMGFEKGFFYGIVLNLGILYWLSINQGTQWYYSLLSMLASVAFLAMFYGLAGSVVGIIGRKMGKIAGILSLPVVFTAMEWLRSLGSLGFTWNNLCYTQSSYLPLIQIVSFTGPFGLSLWIYLVNSLVFLLIYCWKEEKNRWASLLAVTFLFPLLFGSLILIGSWGESSVSQKLTVSVVQPNIDPNEKWNGNMYETNFERLFQLSRNEIINHNSEFVLWPETAVPTNLRINQRNSLTRVKRFVDDFEIPLMTGAPNYHRVNDQYQFYNSVFLIKPEQETPDIYSKIHLVPFGEYIPLSEYFEELKNLNLGQGNFIAGKNITVFKLIQSGASVFITSAVCFESSFSSLIRDGVNKGSQILAILTNDAWFGNSPAPYLHAAIARFRAVENHIPVVRAANTGISMIIDKNGRVLKKSAFNEKTALTATINIDKESTFYTKTGNWIGVVCVTIMILFTGLTFFRRNNET